MQSRSIQLALFTMGFDCGFDIFPRLELNVADKQAYEEFLREVIDTDGDVHDKEGRRADGKVLVLPSDSDAPNKVNIWVDSMVAPKLLRKAPVVELEKHWIVGTAFAQKVHDHTAGKRTGNL